MADRVGARWQRVVAAGVLVGCGGGSAGTLAPDHVAVAAVTTTDFAISGWAPEQYLVAADGDLRLAPDLTITFGDAPATVIAADGVGVMVALAAPLGPGSYPVLATARGRALGVENSLVVGDGAGADAGSDGRADAAPDAPACPPPAPGCTAFSCLTTTDCFYECPAARWSTARDACESGGMGCLVTIHDAAENSCILDATAPAFPDLVWIGYRQTATTDEPAGNWAWECPELSAFEAWGGGEPNDLGGNEDCGLLAQGGGWVDGDCGIAMRYVCRLAR